MLQTKAAKRYAKALLDYSIEKNETENVLEEITAFLKISGENIEFQRLFLSPIVKTNVKVNVLSQVFSKVSHSFKRFIDVLASNKRLSLLEAVAKSFVFQYNEYKNLVVASVTTATPISEELKLQILEKVKEMTGNNQISLENKINPNIIGGFILRVGDLQYNASVLNNFSIIKRNLQENIFVN